MKIDITCKWYTNYTDGHKGIFKKTNTRVINVLHIESNSMVQCNPLSMRAGV